MARPVFETWLADSTGPEEITGDVLQIDVPTSYAARWLTDSLRLIVERIASQELRRPMRVAFHALDGIDDEPPRMVDEPPAPALPSVGTVQGVTRDTTAGEAHVATIARLAAPDLAPGYTVLAGAAGSGRSHVLQAVAHERSGVRVMASREWMARVEAAGATGGRAGWGAFRSYRDGLATYGVLAVDDLDAVAERARKTRQELLHLCDQVCAAGGHVVVATTSPRDLGRDDPLAHRLRAATLIRLARPSDRNMPIVARFIAMRAVPPLPEDVVELLTERAWTTPHDIEGAVRTLAARGAALTARDVADIIDQPIVAATAMPDQPAHEVIQAVAGETGVTVAEIMGAGRVSRVKLARAMAMTRLQDAGWSARRIAAAFPGRDHSGVIRAIRAFRRGGGNR